MKLIKQAILFSFAVAVLLITGYFVRHALLLIYISGIFAVVLSPAVDWICQWKLGGWHPSRGLAIVSIAVTAAILLAGISFFAFPAVYEQSKQFAAQLPDLFSRLQHRFGVGASLTNLNARSLSNYLTGHMATLTNFFGTVAGAVTSTATVLLLTAYLTLEGANVLRWSISLFPPEVGGRLEKTLRRAGVRMRKWLTGQLMLMLILGSASAITFGAMQIRFFYLLALFAGVANFVPFLGPLATVVLAGSVAAIDSLWKALGVLIFYVVYQQVESAFLTPRIMQSQVKLSPAAIITALLLGDQLAGVPGALVAVPSAVLISALINEYLVHDPGKPTQQS